jgi:hypothetical protein
MGTVREELSASLRRVTGWGIPIRPGTRESSLWLTSLVPFTKAKRQIPPAASDVTQRLCFLTFYGLF